MLSALRDLLALSAKLREELSLDLRAIHINHQLSSNAAHWARHCKTLCDANAIDCIVHSVTLSLEAGDSTEEKAREKRYAAFANYLDHDAMVLTAHHQDDQAETLLLQLLRGAGLKGLSAMPVVKPFAKGFLGRPLLSFTRSTLKQYAEENALCWIEDESNANTILSRNFLRHEVMPLLQSRYPSVATTLARTAQHSAEAQALLHELGQQLYACVKAPLTDTLSVTALLQLSPAKQRLLLRHWIARKNYPLPSTAKMESILHDVLTARWDGKASVQWGDILLKRHRDAVYVMSSLSSHDHKEVLMWNVNETLLIDGIGSLQAMRVLCEGLNAASDLIRVSFRQGGERVYQRGMRKSLKNLMQEWRVPPWLRDRIPLLSINNTIVAVPGYFVDERYTAKASAMGFYLVWETNESQPSA